VGQESVKSGRRFTDRRSLAPQVAVALPAPPEPTRRQSFIHWQSRRRLARRGELAPAPSAL